MASASSTTDEKWICDVAAATASQITEETVNLGEYMSCYIPLTRINVTFASCALKSSDSFFNILLSDFRLATMSMRLLLQQQPGKI